MHIENSELISKYTKDTFRIIFLFRFRHFQSRNHGAGKKEKLFSVKSQVILINTKFDFLKNHLIK